MRPRHGLRNWTARLGAAVLAALLLAGPVAAQDKPAADIDPEGDLVSELIVQAATGGPAWWKISKGESTVWVLGAPQSLPKGLEWDKAVLQRHLYGADKLLMPPEFKFNIFEMIGFFLFNSGDFRSKTPLEETLPPPLRARFVAARQSLDLDAGQFEKLKPFVAGMVLSGRFQRPLNMENRQPEAAVARIGRRMKVKPEHVAGYEIMPAIKAFAAASPESQFTCLDDILRQVEAGREPILAAARGWAKGDTRAAVSAERGSDRCTAALPAISSITRRTMGDTADAIAAALEKPGKSVAVVALRPLLAKGGVLEQLTARGFTIANPAVRDDSREDEVPDALKKDDGDDEPLSPPANSP